MASKKDTRSKNATAAERAAANRVPSGHDCVACGHPILRSDLRMVMRISYPRHRRRVEMAAHHTKCYTLL